MEAIQEGALLAPPTEFKRMLSWQLSQVQSGPVFSRSKKSTKKRKQSAAQSEELDSDDDISAYDDATYGSYAYIVVNSDGEEEVYYSAPESPLTSDDDEVVDDVIAIVDAELPPQVKKPVQPGSSDLPYLIHSLLGHDRERRSIISAHVRWLERLLAAYEVHVADKRWNPVEKEEDDLQAQHAYTLQDLWDPQLLLNQAPEQGVGLHCPLPHPCARYFTGDRWLERHHLMRPLFHFASYFLPLMGSAALGRYSGSASLSPSQLSAISYVNSFLRTRYKELTASLAETLKLWPAYVYWARGQLKLAADAFVAAIDSFTNVLDQAVALNEMGRMFLHFGDAPTACKFFRRSADLELTPPRGEEGPRLFTPSRDLIQPCTFALEASAWDCGWLDGSTARQAALAWALVLKECSGTPHSVWYLSVAACESRLCVHAGRSVGENPSSPTRAVVTHLTAASSTFQWLKECVQLVNNHTTHFPILYYHLSLLSAMMGKSDESLRAFYAFNNRYAGFLEWNDGRPGDLFSSSPLRFQRPHPWKPLLDMLILQKLDHAPVMPLQWRVRLLHPLFPYTRMHEDWVFEDVSYLADHEAPAVGLRLTGDGYLTADIHLDLPPLKCVLLDPYTGSLAFSRSALLHHFYLNSFGRPRKQEVGVLPWPQRVFESDHCVVELVMGCTPDVHNRQKPTSNYSASLHWYNSEGVHRRLDVRRIVRKHLRQAILDLAAERNLEDKEEILDKMMEMGQYVHIDYLTAKKVESRFSTRGKSKPGKAKAKQKKQRKHRNPNFTEFALHLSSHMVYGDATLMLCFMLIPECELGHARERFLGQVLMFVNCNTWESFVQPRVYCVGHWGGFEQLWPSPETVTAFSNYHFKHIKFAMALCTERSSYPNSTNSSTQMIFDENGEVVGSQELQLQFSLGDRVFDWMSGQSKAEIHSYNTELKDQLTVVISKARELTEVVPVPGLLFVHTPAGLSLLHPGSLEPVVIKHLEIESEQSRVEDKHDQIQFEESELFFKVIKVYDIEGCVQHPGSSDTEASIGANPATSSSGREDQPSDGPGNQERPQLDSSKASEEEQADAETDDQEITIEKKRSLGLCDFGSCKVAFFINNRLIVLHVPHCTEDVSVVLDVRLPGKVTELHPMGKFGYMVSVTQFPDQFREDIYWLSEVGKLLGMLPCLGKGPRSFVSATLDPRCPQPQTTPSSPLTKAIGENRRLEDDDGGGLYVFFNDGLGGICCIRPSVN